MKNSKVNHVPRHPIDVALEPENNSAVSRFSLSSMVISAAVAFAFSTIVVTIPEIAFTKGIEPTGFTKLIVKPDKPKDIKKRTPPPKESNMKSGGKGSQQNKAVGKGDPMGRITRGFLDILKNRTNIAEAQASALLNNRKFATDIKKVLNNVSSLKTSGRTDVGNRRGNAKTEFNKGFLDGSPDGMEGTIASIIGTGFGDGPIQTYSKNVKIPSPSEIDLGSGGGSRSKASILKIVRKRSPGLRHIYTKYLKQQDGFAGKVTLTFTISASGAIIAIKTTNSTTNSSAFDNEVMTKVKGWEFPAIKSGNTTVTIPFTFSE